MKEKLKRLKLLLEEILSAMDLDEEPAPAQENPSEFDALRTLIQSSDWPEAVFPAQIADENSERDKEERAQGISDIMLPPLVGKRFLDFGCGEGHVAWHAAKEAKASVGYDLERSPKSPFTWEEQEGNLLLTSDFDKVSAAGPFDSILLYDVVDHAEGMSPSELLSKAASVLSDDGRMFVRCHPWCGRHGGHMYRSLNKAFVHLVFGPAELEMLGVSVGHNARVCRPLKVYGEMIEAAGLKNDGEPEIDSQDVEAFFGETPLVRDRILSNWGIKEWGQDPPQFQMAQCFVDYVLKKK